MLVGAYPPSIRHHWYDSDSFNTIRDATSFLWGLRVSMNGLDSDGLFSINDAGRHAPLHQRRGLHGEHGHDCESQDGPSLPLSPWRGCRNLTFLGHCGPCLLVMNNRLYACPGSRGLVEHVAGCAVCLSWTWVTD